MKIEDICFIDVETSGLYPHRHGTCQIGAIIGDRTFFSTAHVPNIMEVDDAALAINGETRDSIFDTNRRFVAEVLQSLRAFIAWDNPKGIVAGGHNPSFDLGFIRHDCDIYGIPYMFSHRSIDTHTMFVDRFGFTCNLDTARTTVGLPEEPKPHNALTGAKCAQQLYLKLKGLPCIQQ